MTEEEYINAIALGNIRAAITSLSTVMIFADDLNQKVKSAVVTLTQLDEVLSARIGDLTIDDDPRPGKESLPCVN